MLDPGTWGPRDWQQIFYTIGALIAFGLWNRWQLQDAMKRIIGLENNVSSLGDSTTKEQIIDERIEMRVDKIEEWRDYHNEQCKAEHMDIRKDIAALKEEIHSIDKTLIGISHTLSSIEKRENTHVKQLEAHLTGCTSIAKKMEDLAKNIT